MRLSLFSSIALVGALTACTPTAQEKPTEQPSAQNVIAYTEGFVFNGKRFTQHDICVSGNVIVRCPKNPGRTVSLANQYITPPFGDAHTHHFDGPFTLDWHTSLNMKAGVFYAMNMTAMTSQVARIRDKLSGPGHVDVSSSLGGITGPESHPAEIYEAMALGFRSYEQQVANRDAIYASRKVADNAYYVVESPDDVKEKMALLLSHDPDHVKVYLRQSERYDEGWGKWGPGGGVDPQLVPHIAALAKAADKRLTLAASSVHDYRVALDVAAYNVTHAPCYQETDADPDSPYYDVPNASDCMLTHEDAKRAAKNALSTTFIVTEWSKPRPGKYLEWEHHNIKMLKDAGADILIGGNSYGKSIIAGLIAGVEKDIFSAPELLKIATMTTPQAIFPDRQLGCLTPGCEASFIAFASDPLENFATIKTITYRLKDGQTIETEKSD